MFHILGIKSKTMQRVKLFPKPKARICKMSHVHKITVHRISSTSHIYKWASAVLIGTSVTNITPFSSHFYKSTGTSLQSIITMYSPLVLIHTLPSGTVIHRMNMSINQQAYFWYEHLNLIQNKIKGTTEIILFKIKENNIIQNINIISFWTWLQCG